MSASGPSPPQGTRPLHVLFIEDSPADVELCLHELRKAGFEVEYDRVETPYELAERLGQGRYDLVLSDYRLPQWTGMDAFQALEKMGVDLPLLLVTGTLGDELAVECLRKGIRDYVLKEKLARLPFAVERVLREKALEDEQKRAAAERERLLHQTQERMKELTCIYQVTRAVQRGASMGEIVREVATLISAAMQYPEAARARVRFEAEEGVSPGFQESRWRLAAPLLVKGEERGQVEVFYVEAPPEAADGPFPAEERELIASIARSLSEAAEHLAAEEALHRSEAHFRALIEQTHDLITITTAGGIILYQSPAAERLLGYPPAEMVGHNGLEFIHPEDRERVAVALEDGVRTPGRFAAVEYRCRHKDGSWRTLHAMGVNLLDDPAVHGVVVSARDITERKRMERQLQFSDAIIRHLGALVLAVNREGQITYASPSIKPMLGYEPQEVLGEGWWRLSRCDPEEARREQAYVVSVLKGEREMSREPYERCVRHRDGSRRWILWQDAQGPANLLVGVGHDVTRLHEAEEALQLSERKYRQLFESNIDPILIFEPGSEMILDANRAACETYGFRREELIGLSLQSLTKDVERGRKEIRKLLHDGVYRNFETVHFRRDGTPLYMLTNSSVIEYEGRKAILAPLRDITKRKQAEEELQRAHDELEARVQARTADLARANQELRQSEGRYRLLMEQAADAILLLAPGGRFTGASSRACELLGYSREELLQMSILDLVHPDQVRTREVEARLKAGELVRLEEEFRSKGGEWIPVEISVRRIAPNEEQLIARDIRERRRAQDAQEQLAAVLEATSDFVATAELTGPLLYVNPAGRRMVGLAEKENLAAHTLGELLPASTRAILEREVVLGGTWTGEAALLGTSGQEIPVLMVASVHQRPCAGAQFMSVVAHDITQRKQLENVKDELVSMVSHELRTPLSSLRGFAELMLTRDYDAGKRREFLGIIHKESKRLADLINNFLDLQRIQSGKQVYSFEALAPGELLQEAVSLFQPGSPQHRLELELQAPLPPARGDRDRVRQVLANLLSNALKYSPEGGRVVLGARQEGGEVRIWVADEGIGIPAELLPHLFTKFYRVDNAVNRGIAGTGLGLALVRQIVENHGGRVWAESAPGRGSTFYFTLPVAQAARQAAA